MALTYENEDRKRRALMGQMRDTPVGGIVAGEGAPNAGPAPKLDQAIPGQSAARPVAPPVPSGSNMTFDQALKRGYKEDPNNKGYALMNSGSGPTAEENATFRKAHGTPESWAEVDRLSGEQDQHTNAGMPPLPTDPPLLPGDDRTQPPAYPPGTLPQGGMSNFGRLAGYDAEKFNDPNKKSAKYQIGRTLSGFDPRQGITPEVLAALNALGFGTFSGSGQRLSLKGLTDAGRAANLQGDYDGADFIVGFQSGDGKWGYADPAAEGQESGMGGDATEGYAGTSSGANTSDYPPEMQAALNNGLAPTDNAYFMKLMEQMRQQSGTPDRKALLSLMK